MLKLYHSTDARSFRALWMLEEMGLDYELAVVPFPPRHLSPGYLEINPLGTVPTLFDGDTRMTESVAICDYLATRYGPTPLRPDADDPDYPVYLNWLVHGEATLTFPQTLVIRYSMLEPPEQRLPQIVDAYTRWFLVRARYAESRLAEHDYLCGDRFTAADISVHYAFWLARTIGISGQLAPTTLRYVDRLCDRDGHRRACEAQLQSTFSEEGAGQ